jgi:tRNA threonylcarbamoyladenosine biosynthesis protein TsaB
MRFILLDTADARGSVAVFEDAEEICAETHAGDQDYSSWLLPAVQRALSTSSLSLWQLHGYAVCAGPGSFTGLRVGLTTVKAWAEAYRRPIASVSRLEALTLAQPAVQEQFLAAFMDARRDQVFAALYERCGDNFALRGQESVMALPDFATRVVEDTAGGTVRWVSPDIGLLESWPQWQSMAGPRHAAMSVSPPFAQQLGRLAFRKFARKETTDALSLEANYVRRSDAEVFWKGNRPR